MKELAGKLRCLSRVTFHNGQADGVAGVLNELANEVDLIPEEGVPFDPDSLAVNDNERNIAKWTGKISAIKAYRDRTRCGLKFAKDMIEAFCKEFHQH